MSKVLPVGKLDNDFLQKAVIDLLNYHRSEVKVRAKIGEDCAVVDFGDYDCVISTDPITASINDIGRLSIHISCNDIASNGVEPLAIVLAVMLPEGTLEDELIKIMKDASEAAANVNVEIIGGHTEVTASVNQPVIVSTAFGRTRSDKTISIKNIKDDDVILLTKKAGMEGTGIIASERRDALKGFLSEEEIATALDMLDNVSVVKEGLAAAIDGTHYMHDVTEGGVLGALWEIMYSAGFGADIYEKSIPVDEVTFKVCEFYKINPLRLISSGAMLILADKNKVKSVIDSLSAEGIDVNIIGKVSNSEKTVIHKKDGETVEIMPPEKDELYNALSL